MKLPWVSRKKYEEREKELIGVIIHCINEFEKLRAKARSEKKAPGQNNQGRASFLPRKLKRNINEGEGQEKPGPDPC